MAKIKARSKSVAIKISPALIVGKITMSVVVAIVEVATEQVDDANAQKGVVLAAGTPEKSTGFEYEQFSILESSRRRQGSARFYSFFI